MMAAPAPRKIHAVGTLISFISRTAAGIRKPYAAAHTAVCMIIFSIAFSSPVSHCLSSPQYPHFEHGGIRPATFDRGTSRIVRFNPEQSRLL